MIFVLRAAALSAVVFGLLLMTTPSPRLFFIGAILTLVTGPVLAATAIVMRSMLSAREVLELLLGRRWREPGDANIESRR